MTSFWKQKYTSTGMGELFRIVRVSMLPGNKDDLYLEMNGNGDVAVRTT